MPAPTTTDEFLQLVRKSGVVETKRLDVQLQKLRSAGPLPEEPSKLAGLLVRDGVLTRFQAEQFMLGKWKRFTIGKYRVLERLGSGGMASVYLCEHILMRRRTAVKVLPFVKAEDPASLERFYREARAVAALDHPNIVRAYDIDQDDKLHFLVMEYVDGSSLQEIVKKHGRMDITRAAHYIRQAAVGLQHAHQMAGLVHRDIKPANLLVDRQGVVKVLDMGLARFFHDEEDILTKKYDDTVLGTADYLAPEQAIDSHAVDIRADIYSLGATFYFLLTGTTPFDKGSVAQKLIWHQTRRPTPVRTIRPEVPTGLAAVLDKMLAKDPGERYQIPAEVVEALAPWTQEAIRPPPDKEMPSLSPAVLGGPGSHADAGPGGLAAAGGSPAASTAKSGPAAELVTPTPTNPHRPEAGPSPPMKPPAPEPIETPFPSATPAYAASKATRPPFAEAPRAVKARAGQRRGRSSAATVPTAHEDDTIPWPSTLAQTPGPAAHTETLAQPLAKPRFWPAHLPRKRWLWLTLACCLLVIPAGFAVYHAVKRPGGSRPAPTQPSAPRNLEVGRAKPFLTVRDALRQARPGDHIVVRDDAIEETLHLESGQGTGVTIESGVPGRRAVWTCPPNPTDGPLLVVANTAGVVLKGFTFAGHNRAPDLIRITGRCPGFVLEDAELEGFTRAGLVLAGCTGKRGRGVVTVAHVRIRTLSNAKPEVAGHAGPESAIRFDQDTLWNQYLTIRACRLEGKYTVAAVAIAGPVVDAEFTHNRVYQAAAGFRYDQHVPCYPLRLDVLSNTFCDIPIGLHFMATPLAEDNSRVLVKGNLFARTGQLVRLEGPANEANLFKKVLADPTDNFSDQPHPQDVLAARPMSFSLATNPDTDAFLRYPKTSPLATAGPDKTPIGVPPD